MEEAEGGRENRGPWRGQWTVEGTEDLRGDLGSKRGQRAVGGGP